MKRLCSLAIIFWVMTLVVNAQSVSTLTGTQTLRLARASYDQGRLHELPAYLLVEKTERLKPIFTQTEAIEAQKLLILTFIYIEEPQKADQWMIELLKTDHFFELSNSDPVEFKTLYKKFRTRPLFRVGLKGGLNQTLIRPIKTYYLSDASAGNGKYKSNLGFQVGGIFEYDLGSKLWTDQNNILERMTLMGEVLYVIQSFNYSNTSLFDTDFEARESSIEHNLTHSRIQLNTMAQYKFAPYGVTFTPYVALGPSVSYLLSADFAPVSLIESRDEFTSPADLTESFKKIDLGVSVAVGGKLKIGGIFLMADLRYQHGLLNVATGKNRYEEQGTSTSFYTTSDFSMSQLMLNFGLIYPHFNPRKLIK